MVSRPLGILYIITLLMHTRMHLPNGCNLYAKRYVTYIVSYRLYCARSNMPVSITSSWQWRSQATRCRKLFDFCRFEKSLYSSISLFASREWGEWTRPIILVASSVYLIRSFWLQRNELLLPASSLSTTYSTAYQLPISCLCQLEKEVQRRKLLKLELDLHLKYGLNLILFYWGCTVLAAIAAAFCHVIKTNQSFK